MMIFSILISISMLIFLIATFFWQEQPLFITRLILIIFTSIYLLFEIKKDYISKNKMLFIIFSAISMIALVISVLIDNASENNNRDYLILIYIYILIVIMYKDLYKKTSI